MGNYPNDIVQILRKQNPSGTPYRDKNGIVIVESAEIAGFLEEFVEVRKAAIEREKTQQKDLDSLYETLNSPHDTLVKTFIDDAEFRKRVLKMLSSSSIKLVSGFVSFLNKCIDETWTRSTPNGAFEAYNQNLTIILDILTTFPFDRFPPAIFQMAAYGLERVGHYVGDGYGCSWAAGKTWVNRKGELSAEIVRELRSVSEQYHYGRLNELVSSISE